jgi:hypothetical protein
MIHTGVLGLQITNLRGALEKKLQVDVELAVEGEVEIN